MRLLKLLLYCDHKRGNNRKHYRKSILFYVNITTNMANTSDNSKLEFIKLRDSNQVTRRKIAILAEKLTKEGRIEKPTLTGVITALLDNELIETFGTLNLSEIEKQINVSL